MWPWVFLENFLGKIVEIFWKSFGTFRFLKISKKNFQKFPKIPNKFQKKMKGPGCNDDI